MTQSAVVCQSLNLDEMWWETMCLASAFNWPISCIDVGFLDVFKRWTSLSVTKCNCDALSSMAVSRRTWVHGCPLKSAMCWHLLVCEESGVDSLEHEACLLACCLLAWSCETYQGATMCDVACYTYDK
jgi:hypothetical protein